MKKSKQYGEFRTNHLPPCAVPENMLGGFINHITEGAKWAISQVRFKQSAMMVNCPSENLSEECLMQWLSKGKVVGSGKFDMNRVCTTLTILPAFRGL